MGEIQPSESRTWRFLKRLARAQKEEEVLGDLGYKDAVVMEREVLHKRFRENPGEAVEWLREGRELDTHFLLELILQEVMLGK